MKYFFSFCCVLLLTACSERSDVTYQPQYSTHPIVAGEKEYIIGIHPLHNPERLHEMFGPIANYLSKHIPGVRFKIEASRNYAAYDKKLYGRQFHFSMPNPFQTINALNYGYRVFAKVMGDEDFRGIILVRKDSGIKNVTDLKGYAVSFPAPTALAATMMPQYYLQMHGLDVMRDIDIRYVGSQESSIMNVMLGDTKAGATWPPPWKTLSKERPALKDELKVIWETEPLPNISWVVRDDVEQDLVLKVRSLLVDLKNHKQGQYWLDKMHFLGFEIATNDRYQPIIEFLDKFERHVRKIK